MFVNACAFSELVLQPSLTRDRKVARLPQRTFSDNTRVRSVGGVFTSVSERRCAAASRGNQATRDAAACVCAIRGRGITMSGECARAWPYWVVRPSCPLGGAAPPLHACRAGGMAPVWPPCPPWGGQWGVPWGSPTVCVGALPPAGCERTEKYGRSVSYALRRLDEETTFVFHYAASEFFPRSSFSALKFGLSTYTDDQYVTQSAVCPSGLFAFGARPEHSEALKFIHCSRSHPWPVLPPERKRLKER